MVKAILDGKEIELSDNLEKGKKELDTLDGFLCIEENEDGEKISGE